MKQKGLFLCNCFKKQGVISKKILRSFIASVLIYSQFLQVAVAAFSPQTFSSTAPAVSAKPSSPVAVNAGPLTPLAQYAQTGTLNNLALNNRQFGMRGPLDLGVTYSDLTGTYWNAQYIFSLGENLAFVALGEYGSGQYRLNGTLGFAFSPTAQIKATAERLGQRLPFYFDSGSVESRVAQNAYGVRIQQLFSLPFFQGMNAGGYWAEANNKRLSPVLFTSNGFNCNGFEAGLQCINYRSIAGATSSGLDAGLDLLLTRSTFVASNFYYDRVRYNMMYEPSNKNRTGFGGGIQLNQLLSDRLLLSGEATLREIYDIYQAGISWLPNFKKIDLELSLQGQHLVSHNATPDNNSISLQVSWLADTHKRYAPPRRNSERLNDIFQWVHTPAVKMKQVLVVKDEQTRLVAPTILSVSPNTGPLSGGNTIIITGTNFAQGLLVYIGGQLASNVQIISPTTIIVTVPPSSAGGNQVVDIVVQNPDGQSATFANAYTYVNETLPIIETLSPTQGSIAGNTTVTITGSRLGTTTSVSFNGAPANIISISDTEVVVSTTAHAAGLVSVVLTTASGSVTKSNAYTYVIPAPVITEVLDGGVLVPREGATNNTTPTINGTTEIGTTVTIYDNGATIGTATVAGDGSWTFIPQTALSVGAHSITATATDGQGNISEISLPYNFTVTATPPPAAPVITAVVVTNTGDIIPDGGQTNQTSLTYQGTTTLGTTVKVYNQGVEIGDATVVGGAWTFPVTSLTEAVYVLTARATDSSGAISDLSNSYTFTVDTTPPPAPTIIQVIGNGVSIPQGGATNDQNPIIEGSASGAIAGADVVMLYDAGGLIENNIPIAADGSWSFQAQNLDPGNHIITAAVRDPAGNVSEPTLPFVFTVDLTPPAPPEVTGVYTSNGVLVPNGTSTNDLNLTIQGTANDAVGGEVRVFDSVSGDIGGTTVQPDGSWSLPSFFSSEGTHEITATVTSVAGNVSQLSTPPYVFILDTTPPAPPTNLEVFDANGSSIASGGTANVPVVRIQGNAEIGTTITLSDDSGTIIATNIAVDNDGAWTYTFNPTLIDGNYSFTAIAVDAAGNNSDPTPAYTFTVDTTPVITAVVDSNGVTIPPDGSTTDSNLTVQGTAGDGLTVAIFMDGALQNFIPVTGGVWTHQALLIGAGTYTFSARAVDGDGNESPFSNEYTITVVTP